MRKTIMIWSALAAAALPGTALADATTSQDLGQVAGSSQSADSSASSTQKSPSNQVIRVSILSPNSSSGNVTQSNSSSAESQAGNSNGTTQNAAQNAAGAALQQIGQGVGNQQDASSSADSSQYNPTNQAIDVKILSPNSSSGNVSQSNSSSAESQAGNSNGTTQNAAQNAGGGNSGQCCGKDGGTTVQQLGQEAYNKQQAESAASSTQYDPSNQAIDVSILSSGSKTGDVRQSNSSEAESSAGNRNGTTQNASQNAFGGSTDACQSGCEPKKDDCRYSCDGHGGTTVQGIGQLVKSDQEATSAAESEQTGASNIAGALDILGGAKYGKQDKQYEAVAPSAGNVSQSNESSAESQAGNTNGTTQNAAQNAFGGKGTTVQALGQAAFNRQDASSAAESTQWCPSNVVFGLFGGNVRQSNASEAESKAGNRNGTTQNASQNAGLWLLPKVI
jgi:hypothetical protein